MQREQPEESLHEQASAWVVRLNAEPSAADLETFELWRAQSPLHARAYDNASAAWTSVGEHSTSPKLLAMRRDALERAHRTTRRWNRRAIAAAIAAFIFVPLAALLIFTAQAPSEQKFATVRGEQRVIVLADGSRMSLDALTSVQVLYRHDERRITLNSGRANFEVARDLSRPMNVKAGLRTVTALGTVFMVEREPQDVVVTLVEGRVAVTSGDPSTPPIEMHARQQLLMRDTGEIALREGLDLVQALAWREGKLVFDNAPLADVVARMNNYVPTPMVAEGKARDLRISGVFKAGDTTAFVEAMESLFPLAASRHQQTITLQMTAEQPAGD